MFPIKKSRLKPDRPLKSGSKDEHLSSIEYLIEVLVKKPALMTFKPGHVVEMRNLDACISTSPQILVEELTNKLTK